MSPKTLIIAAALATAAATTAPAAAQEGESQSKPLPIRAQIMFNLVDVNGDGYVDQTEMAALQRAIFTAVDADSDGKLSAEEFRTVTAGPRMRAARFGHWMGRGGQRGDHRPGDHRGPRDGRQGQIAPQDFEQAPGQGHGHGPGMPMPQLGDNGMGPTGGVLRDFASLDVNGDGLVSADEFAAAAPRLPNLPE